MARKISTMVAANVNATTATEMDTARQYKEALVQSLFGVSPQATGGATPNLLNPIPFVSNIVGIGYGAKMTGDTVGEDRAVRVYVRTKLPMQQVTALERIPSQINGLPTDVIEVGEIKAETCGGSCGHHALAGAGTLGCLVSKNGDATDAEYILSNNHVLALSNAAALLDDIYRPGVGDGGRPPSIASLTAFNFIDFYPPHGMGTLNYMDAAIAKLVTPPILPPVTSTIPVIGSVVNPPMSPSLYQSVRKHGRTTAHTLGVIVDISASFRVSYGTKTAGFDDQLTILGAGGAFSAPGDSGALIVDAVLKRSVGLLFAGGTAIGGHQTFANPIDRVLSHFNVSIL